MKDLDERKRGGLRAWHIVWSIEKATDFERREMNVAERDEQDNNGKKKENKGSNCEKVKRHLNKSSTR